MKNNERNPVTVPAASATRPRGTDGSGRERAKHFFKRHRRLIAVSVGLAAVAGFIVFVVPQIKGLSGTLHRLQNADPQWIALGITLEVLSLGGYVALFRAVFSCHGVRIGWRESAQITLAGTVASKLLATAGAGGVALTVWALRGSGLRPREITRRMITFELLLYFVFAAAMLIAGAGLRIGVFPGGAPWTLTVIPAVIAGGAIAVMLALLALPDGRRIAARARSARLGKRPLGRRLLSFLAAGPRALRDSVGIAARLVRDRNLGLLGAIGYWAFDIGTLWASLHAFGQPPPLATVVMAYFVGQIANLIPLPGGVGGVEGGTIGALIAFGAGEASPCSGCSRTA